MNQRKTMKLWQMLPVVLLAAALFITVFLPAFHLNGNSLGKVYKKMFSGNAIAEMIGGMADEQIEQKEKEFDEQIKEIEEKEGVKFSSISAGRIMTHSFEKFFGMEDDVADGEETDEITASMKSGYNTLRMVFWIIYILAFVVIILVILGFFLKWSKYIPLAVSAVYGAAAAIAFGIFQFFLPKMMVGKAGVAEVLNSFGMGSAGELTEAILPKLIACFWGIAFLMAFIFGLLLLIASVAFMFVGGSAAAEGVESKPPVPIPDPWAEERERLERERIERERLERERKAEAERKRREEELKQKAQAVSAMGQVKCIKGVAAGQGFSLPEDRKVVVGKSNQNANLIISHPNVSNVHCSIRYRAASNTYIVKDHSMNGTFVNGVRMQKDVPMEYPAGTVLQLADGSNEIKLG